MKLSSRADASNAPNTAEAQWFGARINGTDHNRGGMQIKALGELAQAQIRVGMNIAIILLALLAYHYDPLLSLGRVWIIFSICALSATFLYAWARWLSRSVVSYQWRIAQRVSSIVLDNMAISALLYFFGQTLAGAYGIYLWITIGYGARYGVRYLYGNLIASVTGYLIVIRITPFWQHNPSLSIGLGIALIVVPIYASFLIKRLQHAVSEAQRAYAAKSDFVAKMSHELRTPLHGIIAITDLMSRTDASEQQKEMIRIISISSNTLLDLINRILDISKFEDGTFALQRESMDLHAVLNETLSILSPQLPSRALQFTWFIDASIENQLIGSPRQLQEVLINLCGNALKFTERGYVRLAVFADGPNSGEVVPLRFEIEDTGPGIDKEHLEKIFDPFYQADNSVTRRHGGTGLGTAIARELVRLMGGDIQVTSEFGVGTRFTVRIRFERQVSTAPNVSALYPLEIWFAGSNATAQRIEKTLSAFGTRLTALDRTSPFGLPRRQSLPAALIVETALVDGTAATLKARWMDPNRSEGIPTFAYVEDGSTEFALSAGYNGVLRADAAPNVYANMLSISSSLNQSYEPDRVIASATREARILVAEDNSTNQTIARLALTEAGFQFKIVSDGECALEELATNQYTAAIIDMHMPGMDGIEVARLYNFSNPDDSGRVPIIMMTADNRPEVMADADFAGITRFLVKPLKPSLLIEAINSVINPHQDPSQDSPWRQEPLEINFPTVLDRDVVVELLSYMEDADQSIFFAEFLEDARSYGRSVEKINSSTTLDKLRDDMHALCGAARTVGAKRLAAYARRVEFMANDEIKSSQQQISVDLAALIDESERALRNLIVAA